MLTIEQCRGARGLLGWTQQDLADASGLSKTAINNFEKGHSDIKSESLRAIRLAFISADIEFIGDDGLRRRSDNMRIFRGSGAMSELVSDMQDTLRSHAGKDILIAHVTAALSEQISTQVLFDHIEFIKHHNIRQRILCTPPARNILGPQDECRWINTEASGAANPTFIYGSKVAFELWDHTMIVVIGNQEAAEAERRRFEILWAKSAIPSAAHGAAVQTGA